MLESFEALPGEKREGVVNAALAVFGHSGYKKASIADIAAAAGVSKAMIFYWFGCKRRLYEYMADLCGRRILSEVTGVQSPGMDTADFFERIRMASEIKMSVLRKHPGMLDFLRTLYLETDPEVAHISGTLTKMAKGFSVGLALDEVSLSKFREGVDAALLLRFLIWASEGFIRETGSAGLEDVDAFTGDFFRCMDMLKRHLYREEYL
ncbi:MAG: TetR/AcrR family transcriptional regulator [Oscillospiraceae bacterium]|nr:TetR/AcrR family transcriptional regulator [Oscillospiraceae bacterium]